MVCLSLRVPQWNLSGGRLSGCSGSQEHSRPVPGSDPSHQSREKTSSLCRRPEGFLSGSTEQEVLSDRIRTAEITQCQNGVLQRRQSRFNAFNLRRRHGEA